MRQKINKMRIYKYVLIVKYRPILCLKYSDLRHAYKELLFNTEIFKSNLLFCSETDWCFLFSFFLLSLLFFSFFLSLSLSLSLTFSTSSVALDYTRMQWNQLVALFIFSLLCCTVHQVVFITRIFRDTRSMKHKIYQTH
jgi:hypothetical protein